MFEYWNLFGVCFLVIGDCTKDREISGDQVIRGLGFGDWEIWGLGDQRQFPYFPNTLISKSRCPVLLISIF
jgi:hypothetical protein